MGKLSRLFLSEKFITKSVINVIYLGQKCLYLIWLNNTFYIFLCIYIINIVKAVKGAVPFPTI